MLSFRHWLVKLAQFPALFAAPLRSAEKTMVEAGERTIAPRVVRATEGTAAVAGRPARPMRTAVVVTPKTPTPPVSTTSANEARAEIQRIKAFQARQHAARAGFSASEADRVIQRAGDDIGHAAYLLQANPAQARQLYLG